MAASSIGAMTEEIVVLRSAIRPYLEKCEAGDCVIVAVSGGADSLALSYALFKEVAPLALRLVAVTIDHQLQKISSLQAEKVSAQLRGIGYEEVIIRKVTVTSEAGMEAGARSARYGALDEIAARAMAAMDLANLDIEALAAMSRAIRSRIIRSAIYAAGAPIGSISADHVAAIEALITLWRGQGEVSLPGGVKVWRISGRLCLLART